MPPALPRPPGCFLCLPVRIKHIFTTCGEFTVLDHGEDGSELTNATMSVADVPSELPGLGLLGGLSKMRWTQVSNIGDGARFHYIPWG